MPADGTEYEADVGPDEDGPNNIHPPTDSANRDRGDDGLELDKMGFAHCQYHRFPVWVYVDPTAPALVTDDQRVAYAAFEPFPNAKGSGTRISQMLRALAEAGAEVRLYSLPGSHSEHLLPAGVEHCPLEFWEPNFLRRALAFRDRVARELRGGAS